MSYKLRHLITYMVALVLIAISPSVTMADNLPQTGQTSGTVTVNDAGSFNVRLCESSDFGTLSVTSSTGASKGDRTKICYHDDASYRDGFTVTLNATDFVLQNSTENHVIPAENLSIYRTAAPIRTSLNSCPLPDFADNVGLIYATGGNGDLVVRRSGGNNPSFTWPTNNLGDGLQVGRGEAGAGTGVGCATSFGDVQAVILLDLNVPAGQYPGLYKSEFTLDVEFLTP